MAFILQVDFPFAGPWGDEMAEALAPLAGSIALEPGLLWKIWTEDEASGTAGGVYLFETREQAQAYLAMHARRLEDFGVSGVRARIFSTNSRLDALTRAPTPR